MNVSKKLRWIFFCSLSIFSRYSLAVLLGVVLLSDSVGATRVGTGLRIAQQVEATSGEAIRAEAERTFEEGLQLYKQGTAESLQQAIKKWLLALPLWQQVGDKTWEANTLTGIGGAYLDLGNKQQALNFYNQALPLTRQVNDKVGEARTLNNIGGAYLDLGNKQQALNYFNSSLPLRRQVNDKAGEARTLNNIGSIYDTLGEKQQALNYYNSSLLLARQVGNKAVEATTLSNIGLIYLDLGDKQQALNFYNQALPLTRQVNDKVGEVRTLNNIGGAYSDLGDKQQALNFYNQALPLTRQVGNRALEATIITGIGLVYSDLGDKQQALNFYNQALPLTRQVGDKAGEAVSLNNIGLAYLYLGNQQQALNYYNSSLLLARQVSDKQGEATTLGDIAVVERERGNLNSALTQIQAAIDIFENLRTKVDSQDLRTSYFASVQGYYKFYIDLLMRLHKQNPSIGYNAQALHISERARARSLLELLTEAHADIRKDVNPKLLTIERSLQQKLDAKAKLRQQLPLNQQTRAPALKTEIDNLLNSYKELQTQIRTTSPKYAALKYPQPLKLPQIQQQLDKDTLLLQYSLGKERSYVWVVTPNSLQSYELPGQQQIQEAATNFRIELQQQVSTELTAKSANELSQLILAPVADKLGKKRLIIVADGALQNIPFAALTQPSKSAAASNYQPLVVNHEIVSLPSVTTLAFQRQELIGRKRAPKTLAILADPVFAADDERVTGKPKGIAPELKLEDKLEQSALGRAARNLKRDGWERLPGTAEEAKAILKLVASSNRLPAFNFNANYNWVTNEQLGQYRFLHFATHGFADPTNPELSGIVLSLVDKQGQPVPQGYLRLGDIFNLNLPAELIVLSACQTGIGKEVQGEGLVGLTRGLMYAGSSRVAVSLWNVNDKGTSKLMSEFYQQMLQQGKSPAAALRAAQTYMWQQKDWQNPYYWAAFTMQGEWR